MKILQYKSTRITLTLATLCIVEKGQDRSKKVFKDALLPLIKLAILCTIMVSCLVLIFFRIRYMSARGKKIAARWLQKRATLGIRTQHHEEEYCRRSWDLPTCSGWPKKKHWGIFMALKIFVTLCFECRIKLNSKENEETFWLLGQTARFNFIILSIATTWCGPPPVQVIKKKQRFQV